MNNSFFAMFGLEQILIQRKLARMKKPKILAIDFDGCLTDDHVLVDAAGNEFVRASRKDGLGASRLQALGISVVIVSTEENPVVSRRARKMNVEVIQGVQNKQETLSEFAQSKMIAKENIWAVGNDINDISLFEAASFTMCPKDSSAEIKAIANLIIPIKGGEGILNYLARTLEGIKDE
jgi:YrbI family 3-deoxy-D-manno-octulosonate 8-phosphate phosphatase